MRVLRCRPEGKPKTLVDSERGNEKEEGKLEADALRAGRGRDWNQVHSRGSVLAAKKGSLCTSGLVRNELSGSVLYGVNANGNVEGDGDTKGRGTW